MFCCNGVMFNMPLILYTCDFKYCEHSFQMTDKQFPSIRISQDHYMSVVQCLSIFIDFLELHISPWIKGDIMKDHHNFFQEIINFNWRLQLSCNQNLDWSVIFKNVVKLIKHCFVIFFNKFFTTFLFIFDSNWFLTHLFRQFFSFFSFFHLNLIFHYVSLIVDLHSLLFIFNFIRLLLKSSGKLLHAFWALLYRFSFWLSTYLFFVRFSLDFFCHC